MLRFTLALAAGFMALALSESASGSTSRAGDTDGVQSFEDEVLPVLQKRKGKGKSKKTKHYTADKRVRNLKAGAHPIGATAAGHKVYAHANDKGKITGMSLHHNTHGKKEHTDVKKHQGKPTAAKRLPDHGKTKTALAPDEGDWEEAEIVPVAAQVGIFVGFVIRVQIVAVVIWVPSIVVEASIVAGIGVVQIDTHQPAPNLPMLTPRQGFPAITASRRRFVV